MYYIYMLRCEDETLYTGSARDVKKRIKEHFTKSPKSAKYTRSHPPKEIAAVWRCETKSDGGKVEYYIKTLSKKEKDLLLENNDAPQRITEKLQGIVLERMSENELSEIMKAIKG